MKSARTIKEAVERKYPRIGLDDSLGSAIRMMAQSNASALAVVDGDYFIGLVTVTDVMHCLVRELDLQDTRIRSFMTGCRVISADGGGNPCVQLDEDLDVLSALKVMCEAGVNHLVVSGSDNEPVGIVSSLEIIRLLGR